MLELVLLGRLRLIYVKKYPFSDFLRWVMNFLLAQLAQEREARRRQPPQVAGPPPRGGSEEDMRDEDGVLHPERGHAGREVLGPSHS